VWDELVWKVKNVLGPLATRAGKDLKPVDAMRSGKYLGVNNVVKMTTAP
jgi:hypothetical protein